MTDKTVTVVEGGVETAERREEGEAVRVDRGALQSSLQFGRPISRDYVEVGKRVLDDVPGKRDRRQSRRAVIRSGENPSWVGQRRRRTHGDARPGALFIEYNRKRHGTGDSTAQFHR